MTLIALITGANKGIGHETARLLGERGMTVLVGARNEELGQKAALTLREGGVDAHFLQIDVTDDASVQRAAGRVDAEYGRLDVLVNNAGIVRDRMFANTSEEEFDTVTAVHLKGHFATMKHAAAYWRAKSKAGETVDARIINTSSGAGLQGSVGQGNYSAAKAGIAAMTLVASAEMGRYGVTANAIAPSARTRMTETVFAEMMSTQDAAFDAMAPENISPLVVWLGSVESRAVTGKVFEVEGGIIRVAEGWAHGPQIDKGARWDPAELAPVVTDLLAKARPPVPVYGA
jgi:NAD(P)-dependent dehydrogenase (short-subunit alcohol dehydrogenase family)